MTKPEITEAPRIVTSIWPAVLVLVVAVVMLVLAQQYRPAAARFPSMVAGAMILLGVLDLWGRTRLPGSAMIAVFWGTGFASREMMHNPPLKLQTQLVLWVTAAFAGMAAIGILAATPLFCAAYVRWQGKLSWKAAGLIGLGVFAFQFAVFELVLDYELYRGLAFTRGGIAAW